MCFTGTACCDRGLSTSAQDEAQAWGTPKEQRELVMSAYRACCKHVKTQMLSYYVATCAFDQRMGMINTTCAVHKVPLVLVGEL